MARCSPSARHSSRFLRLRCGDCGHDKLFAFSCKRRGFCPSCGARRMAQTAVHLVDHALALPPGRSPCTNSPADCLCPGSLPHVPVRQRVLALPIPLRRLLAAQRKLMTPVLQVVHCLITRHLLGQAGLEAGEAGSGAVTLIALTFNGHGIHDARRQATEVEGGSGLAVHGPMIGPLLPDLLHRERPGTQVASSCFEAVRPTFDLHAFKVCGWQEAATARLWARDHEGWRTMEATATRHF